MVRITPEQQKAVERLAKTQDESALWDTIVVFQEHPFLTATGLPFTYTIKRGKNGAYNKELLIDRRGNSKTLTWSSIRLAYEKALEMKGQTIVKPKV